MNEDNYVHKNVFLSSNVDNYEPIYLYKYLQPADYFILLLDGDFIIEAGEDGIELLAKQHDHFGENALLGLLSNPNFT